jgi:hypothetical protein
MKKIFLFLTAGIIPMVAIMTATYAQHSKLGFEYYAQNASPARPIKDLNSFKMLINAVSDAVPADNSVAGTETISKKALKNFKASFGNQEAATWYQLPNGFVAHFTVNNIANRSYYDKNGNWLYSTRYYDEKSLPADIRKIVRSTYYDFAITGVQEIKVEEKIIFLVHVKDEASLKTIRVCEGDMQEIESFKNSL